MLESGSRLNGELNYYEYGVVSIKLEMPFQADWPQLTDISSRWMTTPELEAQAVQTVRRCRERGAPGADQAVRKLAERRLLHHSPEGHRPALTAGELIAEHGGEIARIVRGEQAELSVGETEEILGSRLSYYPDDLLVVGWTAAFIHDTAEDAVPTIQLLEYANYTVARIPPLRCSPEPVAARGLPLAGEERRLPDALAPGIPGPAPKQDPAGYSRAHGTGGYFDQVPERHVFGPSVSPGRRQGGRGRLPQAGGRQSCIRQPNYMSS